MKDVLIVSGFSDYNASASYAMEDPFRLYVGNHFGDLPGLYSGFADTAFRHAASDYEAPPFVCYALKQMLHNRGYSSEMIFYLDLENERAEKLLSESYRAVFLTTTLMPVKGRVLEAVRLIRQRRPETPLICGGVHTDRSWQIRKKALVERDPLYAVCGKDYFFLDDESDAGTGIDLFIMYDPDLTVAAAVLEGIKKGKTNRALVEELPNLARHENGWSFSKTVQERQSLLFPIDWGIFRPDEVRVTVPMVRSKNCLNRCRYCNFQKDAEYLEKGEETLEQEMQSLLKNHSKVSFIHFCDDNICGPRRSITGFTQFLAERRYPLKWFSFFDARFIDDELAAMLRASGCLILKIGMESGDDGQLRRMAKPCRVADYHRAVRALVKQEISLDAFFVVGFPGETRATLEQTAETVNAFPRPHASLNHILFFPFILAPMAPVFDRADREKFGLSGYMHEWTHKTMSSAEANAIIPEISGRITALNPMHGNIEYMLAMDKRKLLALDNLRGDFIRMRVKTGGEDRELLGRIANTVKDFKLIKPGESDGEGMVRPYPRFK